MTRPPQPRSDISWWCLAHWLIPPQVCTAGGTYLSATGGASGAAHKHTTETQHPTMARWHG